MNKEQYLAICYDRFEQGRQRFIELVASLDREHFMVQAEARWDRARSKYGPNCDLPRRDLLTDAAQEAVDGVIYLGVDAELQSGGGSL